MNFPVPISRYLTFFGFNTEKACRSPATYKLLNVWTDDCKQSNLLILITYIYPDLFKLNDLPCFYSREETHACYPSSAAEEDLLAVFVVCVSLSKASFPTAELRPSLELDRPAWVWSASKPVCWSFSFRNNHKEEKIIKNKWNLWISYVVDLTTEKWSVLQGSN